MCGELRSDSYSGWLEDAGFRYGREIVIVDSRLKHGLRSECLGSYYSSTYIALIKHNLDPTSGIVTLGVSYYWIPDSAECGGDSSFRYAGRRCATKGIDEGLFLTLRFRCPRTVNFLAVGVL